MTDSDQKRRDLVIPFFRFERFFDCENDCATSSNAVDDSAAKKKNVLIDAGAFETRCGLQEDEEPRIRFRSCATRGKFKERGGHRGVFVGEYDPQIASREEKFGFFECGRTAMTQSVKDQGLFCDQEVFEALVHKCVRELGLTKKNDASANSETTSMMDNRAREVRMTEPLGNPSRMKDEQLEILIEKLEFGTARIVSECESAGIYNEIKTGAIVNMGYSNCSILPFLDGKMQMKGATRVDVGGEKLIDCFGKMALDAQRAENVHKMNFLNQMFMECSKIGSGRMQNAFQTQLFRDLVYVSRSYDEETKMWRDQQEEKEEYEQTKILQFQPQYGVLELDLRDVVQRAKHNFDKKLSNVKRFGSDETIRKAAERYAKEFENVENDPEKYYEVLLSELAAAEKNLKDARYARSLEIRGVTEEEANEELERNKASGGGGRKGVRRQTAAARKRARLMAEHAGNKEKLDEVEAEEKENPDGDRYGDKEEDWAMYTQMARGADKAIDGEINDPGAQKVSACEAAYERSKNEVLAVDPQYEIRNLSGLKARQIKIRAERIRATEALFHPEILASKGIVKQIKDARGGLGGVVDEFIMPQGGIQDALKEAFARCSLDVQKQIHSKGNEAEIILTGGLSRIPGVCERLQDYVISNSYPGMAPKVRLSNDSSNMSFDAWKGLRSNDQNLGVCVTREQWLEHGSSFFYK